MITVDPARLLQVEYLAATCPDPQTRSVMMWIQALATESLQANASSSHVPIPIDPVVYGMLAPLTSSPDPEVSAAAAWGDSLVKQVQAYNGQSDPPSWPRPKGGPAQGWWG